ncbi:MAG: hypothetical protein FWE70_02980 [Oscillospiraceae bacterium]|nr:hypothetical protein [Oscillospiraceae bacterium]
MVDRAQFKDPGPMFRPTAFWGLNGVLEEGELRRQIGLFNEQGFGGAYLHPRAGMVTDYLSEDYFLALDACVGELARLGMKAWLYDEDWCPSGKAGDKVCRSDPGLAQRYIVPSAEPGAGYEVMQAKGDKGSYRSVNVDVCDKAAIDRFIEITHERYKERYGHLFGGVMPAIFTDEPHFRVGAKDAFPWTVGFEDRFAEKYGYGIQGVVSDLWTDTPTSPRTRLHFWSLISAIFVESYTKNLYEWCDKAGIALTGHYWEHSFPSPTHTGSCMPHYLYMHYPGIDVNSVADMGNKSQYGNDMLPKEASSVANQFGRERVLSETNGNSGWGLSLAEQRRVYDWQLALGVNLFTLHLSYYDISGYRKRDFPLSFHHEPWWDDFRGMSDYIGRLSYALSLGTYQADVLVLHPSSSTWTAYGGADSERRLSALFESFHGVLKALCQERVMFDLGDDAIMAEHGKVEGAAIAIGAMAYKVVVAPSMEVMTGATFRLLEGFVDAGGRLVCAGRPPRLLDGEDSEALAAFFGRSEVCKADASLHGLAGLVTGMGAKCVRVLDVGGAPTDNVYGHVRRQGDTELTFLCNLDTERSSDLMVFVGKPCKVTRYDTETGDVAEEACAVHAGAFGACPGGGPRHYVRLRLGALSSALLVSDESAPAPVTAEAAAPVGGLKVARLIDWDVRLAEPNIWSLHRCRASLDGGPFAEPGDVLVQDDRIKDRLGMERAGIWASEPWMFTEAQRRDLHVVAAEYAFLVGEPLGGALSAAVELQGPCRVLINGAEVTSDGSFLKDRAFAAHDIAAHVRPGENVLRIEVLEYGVMTSLECAYLFGDFRLGRGSADEPFVMYGPRRLAIGGIAAQGCPYYSGKLRCSAEFRMDGGFSSVWLDLGGYEGESATIRVNGVKARTVYGPTSGVEVTGLVRPGANAVTVEIANTMQNMMGPHDSSVHMGSCHPGSFYAPKHDQFKPFGFGGLATVKWK